MRRCLAVVASLGLLASCGVDGGVGAGPDASADAAPQDDAGTLSDAAPQLDAAPRDGGTATSDSGPAPTDAGRPDGAGLREIVTAPVYEAFFPHRDNPACEGGFFTYAALLEAAATFPDFCNTGGMEARRREAAAFLANVSHETTGGWPTAPDGPQAWGLCFKEEIGCADGGCTGYCNPAQYPCAPGKTYHGRGPMQLSWNYNYAQAGEALGLDLVSDPDLVTRDPVVAWSTAIWFWMTPQPPKPSAHEVMVGLWTPSGADTAAGRTRGFGMTVNIVNGGLECGIPADSRVEDRVAFYERYCEELGVRPGDNVYCDMMDSY